MFSWLENLAAKQGATEGLLTKPEERREEEPDWVKQAKDSGSLQEQPTQQTPSEETPETVVQPTPEAANVEELGKSDEERDNSFSWLENLAARQGATEGLLTKPEERREEEPDWVKQAKDSAESEPPAQAAPAETPSATEEDDMDWVKNAKEVGEQFFDELMGASERGS